ncbi:probable RNA methyltransferase Y17G7B.18 [Trichonephila inaurata madagascariensis]|uniref:RNA methyltransferase n=1 Tax=Trichonephila inaurata madagascariensis TaxID=2747483 RepID=A0A8X7CU36_9ARAC|nr:probable RNA methyltransferase Y17G7B.18 [Trichonephila inaurata madagascariensis]
MAPPHEKYHQFSESFCGAKYPNISFGKRSHENEPFINQKWEKNKKLKAQNEKHNQKKEEAYKFRFGNYHQYYGYRNQGQTDPRITCMKQEWFSGKDVLDIGCNAGHFTLALAKYFSPKCIIAYGPVAQSMDSKGRYSEGKFPFNVQFIQANFILSSDEFVNNQMQYFDTVLCLSVTKWVHLNWGDIGIKRLFHRAHKLLRPGGSFILEAQTFHIGESQAACMKLYTI